jgi:ABC-type polysaccharide/polyol phosphate export permease
LGYLVAVVAVYVRDFQQLLPSLLNLWFFLTPVFYSLDLVPPWLRGLLEANPWSVILAWYRQLFLAPELRWGLGEAWVALGGALLLRAGLTLFRRGARYFPDVL